MRAWDQRKKPVFALLAVILFLSIFLHIQNSQEQETVYITEKQQLEGRTIGLLVGSNYRDAIQNAYPNSTLLEFSTPADLLQALRGGRIQAYITSQEAARNQLEELDGLGILGEPLLTNQYAYLLDKGNEALCDQINDELDRMEQDGSLSTLAEKWGLAGKIPSETPEAIREPEEGTETLHVGAYLNNYPFAYEENGRLTGYDVELIRTLASRLGYGVQITGYTLDGVLNSLESGLEQIAVGGLSYTQERGSRFLFTNTTGRDGIVTVVLAQTEAANGGLRQDIHKTLVEQQRWKSLLQGCGVTATLAFFTLLLGTALGFCIVLLMHSERMWLRKLTDYILRILETIPLLVMLLLFYYVVFSKLNVSAMLVGVVGLTLNFAITVSGLLDTGLLAVSQVEIDGARAMGYRNWQILYKVALPQAVRQMYAQYLGAVSAMIKDTSIVGYITVPELTSVGDGIRSTTFQTLLPLLTVSVLYFLLSKSFTGVLMKARRLLELKPGDRRIRGVKDL